jgi:hypothetical protein
MEEGPGGPFITDGTQVETAISIGPGGELMGCQLGGEGPMIVNDHPKDKVSATTPTFAGCFGGQTITGSISGDKVSFLTMTTKAKLAVTEEGCIYSFRILTGSLTVPGPVTASGEVTGKLVKRGSAATCAPTRTDVWETALYFHTESGKELVYAV